MAEDLTVQVIVNAPIEKVWDYYTRPEHITQWNHASDDWFSPRATNDLRAGGRFISRMEAKDGSEGFDFSGTYDEVVDKSLIKYTMDDNRKATITMAEEGGQTKVIVTFEAEKENAPEFQESGWQAILDNFKKYTESH